MRQILEKSASRFCDCRPLLVCVERSDVPLCLHVTFEPPPPSPAPCVCSVSMGTPNPRPFRVSQTRMSARCCPPCVRENGRFASTPTAATSAAPPSAVAPGWSPTTRARRASVSGGRSLKTTRRCAGRAESYPAQPRSNPAQSSPAQPSST